MGYSLLSDLLIIEVAQFGPDALGGYLADLGARVIKVEEPETGDPLRRAGALSVGEPNGFGYMHLRWNRGKQSVALDLEDEQDRATFIELARRADAVVEGMRAGVLDRLGLGYEVLRKVNPALVFCSISGLGTEGPYAAMASHGPSFDAFGGIGMPLGASVGRYDTPQPAPIGMHAMGVYGALGVLAAIHAARRSGEGASIEVAAAECSAHWLPEAVDPDLNRDLNFERPGFLDSSGRMRLWARMENYRTRDDKILFLQTFTDKSWKALLNLIGRPDLDAIYHRNPQTGTEDAEIARELAGIFAGRDRDEWMRDFLAVNVAAMPVNTSDDLLRDAHFLARDNVYQADLPGGAKLRLLTSPIRVAGERFTAPLAPELDEHGAAVRTEFSRP